MKKLLIINLFLLAGCSKIEPVDTKVEETKYKMSVDSFDIPVEKVPDVINCPITPEVELDVTVPQIYKTNNLRKRTGYATFARGKFIMISGTVTDSFCVPIKNATVQIWQADANGKYKSIPNDSYLNDSMLYGKQQERFENTNNDETSDENFTGSGSTITDNLGRFTFISVMPGGAKPSVNFRVIHKDFNDTKTIMYFDNLQGINQLLVAKKGDVIELDGVKEQCYQYNITLNGKNKYVNY